MSGEFGEYEDAEFWARDGWLPPWMKRIAPDYFREMIPMIGEHWMKRANWREHILTDAGRANLRGQLVTRLSQAADVFAPWLAQALKMDGLRVLEIGCGSGSSTAGLAHAGARVTGVDIKGPSLTMAAKRLSLLGLEARFLEAEHTWLQQEVDASGFAGPYDLIVCYAVMEHLLIPERLNLLALAKTIMQRDGALLATFETPNRFAPFDWHSSKVAFMDVLPDALVYRYAKEHSPRADHPARRKVPLHPTPEEELYRFGRGVSWHEFDLGFGIANLDVVLDGYSPRSKHQKNYRSDAAYETALAGLFAKLDPPVPRGFCRPSLELLLKYAPRRP